MSLFPFTVLNKRHVCEVPHQWQPLHTLWSPEEKEKAGPLFKHDWECQDGEGRAFNPAGCLWGGPGHVPTKVGLFQAWKCCIFKKDTCELTLEATRAEDTRYPTADHLNLYIDWRLWNITLSFSKPHATIYGLPPCHPWKVLYDPKTFPALRDIFTKFIALKIFWGTLAILPSSCPSCLFLALFLASILSVSAFTAS